jgi:hypothetical protein
VDQHRGIIELLCSPDYVRDVRSLLDSLKDEMKLRILDTPNA